MMSFLRLIAIAPCVNFRPGQPPPEGFFKSRIAPRVAAIKGTRKAGEAPARISIRAHLGEG